MATHRRTGRLPNPATLEHLAAGLDLPLNVVRGAAASAAGLAFDTRLPTIRKSKFLSHPFPGSAVPIGATSPHFCSRCSLRPSPPRSQFGYVRVSNTSTPLPLADHLRGPWGDWKGIAEPPPRIRGAIRHARRTLVRPARGRPRQDRHGSRRRATARASSP